MQSLVKARRDRAGLERQALALFRVLLKAERGRTGLGPRLLSPRDREAMARRVKTIESEILKLRRALRRIRAGQ
jgi:hypothetical protein